MRIFSLCLLVLFSIINLTAQNDDRWSITPDGGIQWKTEKIDSHMDHIEMSGFHISAIVHYGVKAGRLQSRIHLVFPMLRTIPNDTHGSLAYTLDGEALPKLQIDGQDIFEYPLDFYLKGYLEIRSTTKQRLEIKHTLFPSTDQTAFIDRVVVKNNSGRHIKIDIPKISKADTTAASDGVEGSYVIQVESTKSGIYKIQPDDSLTYNIIYTARPLTQKPIFVSPEYELQKRKQLIEETFSNLSLETPDTVLNLAFNFAKLRAVESIYATQGGLMHGPGGGRYYAAIWANDQAEYANPFFPFLGNLAGNESAINSFRHFARFMNEDYHPIPSSIIAEGLGFWNGAGDRGDMAMIAYGAARFCLAYGDKQTAIEIWPLIEWCLEYCRRKLNSDGVVQSDCDELENRFPAGKANLNTSSLYYDALISSAALGTSLGVNSNVIRRYSDQADKLREAIDNYFGATIAGYETYRYYKENETLRAWICTPLTVGLFDRANGTIDALFSEALWTSDGLATEAGQTTFWDRATLYALRGVFAAGATHKAMVYLRYYSNRRLLGEHVPYPVEAYPEGNQRHLSAESALYCRVITEGLFGIRPVDLNAFAFTPRLPEAWDGMTLKKVKAFGLEWDLIVNRDKDLLRIKVYVKDALWLDQVIQNGTTLLMRL